MEEKAATEEVPVVQQIIQEGALATLSELKRELLKSTIQASREDQTYYSLLTLVDYSADVKSAVKKILANDGSCRILRFWAEQPKIPVSIKNAKKLQIVFELKDAPPNEDQEPVVKKRKVEKEEKEEEEEEEEEEEKEEATTEGLKGTFVLNLVKYVKYVTPKVAERDLKNHDDPLAKRIYELLCSKDESWGDSKLKGIQATAVLCHGIIEEASSELIEKINTTPLHQRFTMDVQLGVYDAFGPNRLNSELAALGVDEVALVNSFFQHEFKDLDFENLVNPDPEAENGFEFEIDNYSNFQIELTLWDRRKIKVSSMQDDISPEQIKSASMACASLLRNACIGTRVARWGYSTHKFDNYFGLFKRKKEIQEGESSSDSSKKSSADLWMAIHYCVDNASCGGFVFSVTSWASSSLERLWRHTGYAAKMQLLRANLGGENSEEDEDEGEGDDKGGSFARKYVDNAGYEDSDSEVSD